MVVSFYARWNKITNSLLLHNLCWNCILAASLLNANISHFFPLLKAYGSRILDQEELIEKRIPVACDHKN